MDLHKILIEDIRTMDAAALRETETNIRRELLVIRMDIYNPPTQSLAKKRALRRNLARVLTIRNKSVKSAVATPKAPVVAKAKRAVAPSKPAKKVAPKVSTKAVTGKIKSKALPK